MCVLLDWLLLVIFEILEYIKYWILDLIQYNDFLVGPQRFAQVVFQTRAPVKSVVYDTPYARANQYSIDTVVDLYRYWPCPIYWRKYPEKAQTKLIEQ